MVISFNLSLMPSINIDPNEKAAYEELSRHAYHQELEELEQQRGVTSGDIDDYKKCLLLKRSLEDVRERAQEMKEIRKSPERYSNVKSKVKRNVKVRDRVIK
jgi:hypothetical protein